jgi:hypothetical protein
MRAGKGGMTAADIIRQWEHDPVHQAKLREMEVQREQLRRRCIVDEQELVAELRTIGLAVDSVYDLVNNRLLTIAQN